MKSHRQKGLALVGVLLLAAAAVLGWSHSSKQRETSSDREPPSNSSGEEKVFSDLPRSAVPESADPGSRAAKVAERSRTPSAPAPGMEGEAEAERPRPGETVYQMSHLPKACGTYWVENPDGSFGRVAICNPENHPEGSH